MNNSNLIPFFVRDDDVERMSDCLKNLLRLLKRWNIPLHLAVIPKLITKETASFLKNEISNNTVEIGQHGYRHKLFIAGKKRFEFGSTVPERVQEEWIRIGKKLLNDAFDRRVTDVFIPPYHGYNKITLKCIDKLKFKIISDGTDKRYLRNYSFHHLPVNLDITAQYLPIPVIKSACRLKDEFLIISKKYSYVGLLIHHELLNKKDFVELNKFMEWVTKQNIVPCHLSRMIDYII